MSTPTWPLSGRSAGLLTRAPLKKLETLEPGFRILIEEVAALASVAPTAFQAIEICATFGYRLDVDIAESRLGLRVGALYSTLSKNFPQLSLHKMAAESLSEALLMSPDGCIFSRPSTNIGDTDGHCIGYIVFPDHAYREFQQQLTEDTSQRYNECEAFRYAITGDNNFLGDLQTVSDTLTHMAPVTFYVNELIYTNFRGEHNLTGTALRPGSERCVITNILNLHPNFWKECEVTIAFALVVAFRNGGYLAIENLNGCQITLPVLLKHLNKSSYGMSLEMIVTELLTYTRQKKPNTGQLTQYRWIFGPTLLKTQKSINAAKIDASNYAIPYQLRSIIKYYLGVNLSSFEELQQAFRTIVAQYAQNKLTATMTGLSAIEEILYKIVVSVLHETSADIAMTRGMRNLVRIIDIERRSAWDEAIEWGMSEFFTCVIPSKDCIYRQRNDQSGLERTLWSIAARMQFNSWHFLPGNFLPSTTREKRDYFLPPMIPDLAEWSDQHHRGHVMNRVRFSIRAPQPVHILDRDYSGFIDVRLMRQKDGPFTIDDLSRAVVHSQYIQALHQAIIDTIQNSGESLTFNAFDREWYSMYVKDLINNINQGVAIYE